MQSSPLIRFVMAGLARCFMPERGLWSYKYHLDGRPNPNEARPEYDIFYSLNVLLGFSKLPSTTLAEAGLDPRDLLPNVTARLLGTNVPHYAYGMALWAAVELQTPVPDAVLERVLSMTADAAALRRWPAQHLGLLLSGAVAQSRADIAWTRLARTARDIILDDLQTPSGVFRDCAVGFRRFFGTFATQVYCALALYHYNERFDDARAGEAADRCVERLIALQGPRGEWPWFYDAGRGTVLDFYEVYSVHQHGMGPAVLRAAMRRGVPGARDALARGFGWILGNNVLSRPMLDPETSLIARSQARRGWAGERAARIGRSALVKAFSLEPVLDLDPKSLVVTPEVRSYELGWTLWSFGDDTDFPELTHHESFGSDHARSPSAGAESSRGAGDTFPRGDTLPQERTAVAVTG